MEELPNIGWFMSPWYIYTINLLDFFKQEMETFSWHAFWKTLIVSLYSTNLIMPDGQLIISTI